MCHHFTEEFAYHYEREARRELDRTREIDEADPEVERVPVEADD
ncbi:hypothetical protein [Halomarina halobia]|uniref:Uncharacterized protein n=1 Tax=Halomarina halobia TaxID=3033386 RepID=A0ABD6A7Z9_9EURY